MPLGSVDDREHFNRRDERMVLLELCHCLERIRKLYTMRFAGR